MCDDYNDFGSDKRSCHTEWISRNGREQNMAPACLVNHDLLGKIFLKLAKFSSFVAASIPHSFLNSTGKPFNRWRIQLHAGMSEIYINTPVKHFRRKNARN